MPDSQQSSASTATNPLGAAVLGLAAGLSASFGGMMYQSGAVTQPAPLPIPSQFTGQDKAMSNPLTPNELDAKIALSDAKTDTKFAQLIGKIDASNAQLRGDVQTIAARIEGIERSTSGIKSTVIGVGIGTIAVVIAVLAFGQQWFDTGLSTRDMIVTTLKELQHAQPTVHPLAASSTPQSQPGITTSGPR